MRSLKCGALLLSLLCVSPLVLAPPTPAFAQSPDREFTMSMGETLTLNARGVNRVSVGRSDVADVQTSGDQRVLVVTAKGPGVTTINIFTPEEQKTLLIRVVPVNPASLAEEVREVLGERSGVDVRVVKGRVLLEGEVASELFKKKIDVLTTLYKDQVLNFTNYREAFVEGARMVALDVHFVQMATTRRDNLGVNWNQFLGLNTTFGTGDVPLYYESGDLNPGVLPSNNNDSLLSRPASLTGGSGLTSYWSLVGNLNASLDFLTQHGLIRTVQRATIVTEAGTEANYHSGGTLLIPIVSQNATGIVEKEYGLKLKVQPILDFENRVKLNLNMEYAELDYANGIQGIPAIRNTDINSVVNMQEGQSVLVTGQAGVVNTSTEKGFWMLDRIPIVGWAFKSRDYLGTGINNGLFITPRVYEPGGDVHKTLVNGVFRGVLQAGAEPEDLPTMVNAPR